MSLGMGMSCLLVWPPAPPWAHPAGAFQEQFGLVPPALVTEGQSGARRSGLIAIRQESKGNQEPVDPAWHKVWLS